MKIILLCLLLFEWLGTAAGMGDEIPLLIFAGQSNAMSQETDTAGLSPSEAAPQTNVYFFNAYSYARAIPNPQWIIYQPPTDELLSNRGIFGQEITAAQLISQLVYHGKPVAIFKFVLGSTSINVHWNPNLLGSRFWEMKARVLDSLARMPAETGHSGRVAGFFWTQGEDDAGNLNVAEQYGYNLSNFIAHVRGEFNEPQLPFIFAKLLPFWLNANLILQHQTEMLDIFSDIRLIRTDDLSTVNWHFNNQGTIELGNRYGRAFVDVITSRHTPVVKKISPGEAMAAFGDNAGTRRTLEFSPDLRQWFGATNVYLGADLFFQTRFAVDSNQPAFFMRLK